MSHFSHYRTFCHEYKLIHIKDSAIEENTMKQITGVYTAPRPHWVGDGFPVRSLFSYQSHAQQLSPFLLLDYAGRTHLRQVMKNAALENIHTAVSRP
ncbi:pirin-like protein [Salmonella enterica subsp. arizonae]|uniref:Pirin-like protein n=1 Tax=Salmonella enterica subsp. arizonae TaxID=59203 RepID=A0A3S4G8U0_SALER|nr:pirin-like protein [Salmonella enterica subsp. arizonae]